MKLKHAQLRKTTAFFTLTLYWRLPTPIYLTISNEKKQSIDRYTIIVERTENYIYKHRTYNEHRQGKWISSHPSDRDFRIVRDNNIRQTI